jgi:hypothetical protein
MVKRFMDDETIRKISLYDSNNPSQIEKKFGGDLENIKVFW